MKNLHLAAIALVACAAGNARTGTSRAGSLCDSLPAPTCKDGLPPVKPWDGNALPQPQTDHGFVLIHRDGMNPGTVIAATTDDGVVISLVSLSEEQLAKLVLLLLADDGQKADASVHHRVAFKVTPSGGPRKPSAEFYRQSAAIELAASDVANERAEQCQ
jgi:hypothetical protein